MERHGGKWVTDLHARKIRDEQLGGLAGTWSAVKSLPGVGKLAVVEMLLREEHARLRHSWLTAAGFSFEPGCFPATRAAAPEPGKLDWHCTVPGVPGTLMDGALFIFNITFSEDFPLRPPLIK
jgi:hypothetical protein